MKIIFVLFFVSTFVVGGLAQNLVTNPDFEINTVNNCLYSFYSGFYEVCDGWYNAASFNFAGSSADYSTCGYCADFWQPSPFDLPSGNGAVALASGSGIFNELTEAITSDLSSTVYAGTELTISLEISPRSGSLNNQGVFDPNTFFGIYLYTSGVVPSTGVFSDQHLTAKPQIIIPTVILNLDKWNNYTIKFTPSVDVNKIAIGFFNPHHFPTSISRYFAIDNVIVKSTDCGPCNIPVASTAWTWTGCFSSDWFNPCNWDRQSLPGPTSEVVVPLTVNQPLITNGVAFCKNITIDSDQGASVELNTTGGGELKVFD